MFQLYFSHFNLFEGQTLFESAVKFNRGYEHPSAVTGLNGCQSLVVIDQLVWVMNRLDTSH